VSVPLEYEVASGLPLVTDKSHISSIALDVSLIKTKTKTALSGVLSMASDALKQLPIPANPYTQVGSKILEFANKSVDTVIQQNGPYETAHLGLAFADKKITDISKCESSGKERTGAIVVLFKTGYTAKNQSLLDVTNVDSQYCISYSSEQTFEAIYAPRNADKSCPKQGYKGVPNDYLMFLLSADPAKVETKTVVQNNARVATAVDAELSTIKPPSGGEVTKGGAGGIARGPDVSEISVVGDLEKTYGQDAQVESIARCKALKLPLSACGVE
jgi:hypothetical protein